ncbi:MAG: RdgB/HAM1 family non-canonical purine NTP pyrophosphatase [Candidatus Heimdallarchaeota archaeon]|nr:RdgB/HAM1 family non-canonical purine NTP pyrophosphatase [Candidatus Heimdallarchaeota archaeon]
MTSDYKILDNPRNVLRSLSFVTSNTHKFKEVNSYFTGARLSNMKFTINHLNQKYTELQADTISEVAHASASSLSTIMNHDFLIEDSGITVNRLNGFPGPYSSFVFQTVGWQGILDLLGDQEDRSAFFTSVFVLSLDKKLVAFEGEVQGSITIEAKGNFGFGFDPIFIPEGQTGFRTTLAEMETDEKNEISHRGKSLRKLFDFLIQK